MITKSIPSMFTIGNLFLGIIAILFVFNEAFDLAAIMVIIAMLMDGLDGRVARALNVQSEFGKELDSLSDVISFGVAPALIAYVVAFQEIAPEVAGWLITALFPTCGALRLARFNVVNHFQGHFIGLPIPAAGGILCALALFHDNVPISVLIVVTIVLSGLMVSNVKYPSFKKLGFPKTFLWLLPVLLTITIVLAAMYPGQLTGFIFIPLVIYTLYGFKKKGKRQTMSLKEGTGQEEEEGSQLNIELVDLEIELEEKWKRSMR